MDKGSFAAAELMVFLGLAGWLLYYQFSTSRRDSNTPDHDVKDDTKASDD
ncbi:hypothetical protein [Thiocystis violacea]|nr:hypothetical protein [Thiocystis violacea]